MSEFVKPQNDYEQAKNYESEMAEDRRQKMAAQQLEQQKIYKSELASSYKRVLRDQMAQHDASRAQESVEKQNLARLNQQRSVQMREQEYSMKEQNSRKAQEYR